jgi:serine/threonine-protein kinase
VSDAPDFEPYVSLGRIESGPTFDVYLARHVSLQRLVWIKVLREHVPLSSPFAARLTREGQFLARIDHVNVVDIIDCVRRPPRLWLVLEAIDGWSLADVIAQVRRAGNKPIFDARGVAALGLQLARALAHTHEAGILHGAVWPQHIVVSKLGLSKLTGFSLAENLERQRESAPPESEPGAFEPAYLSPEQVREEVLDERSDLFSLGVVMYELLAGQRPFQGAGDGSPALEKQRERRFDSAGQLVSALEHVLGSEALADLEPIVARALAAAGLAVPSAAPSPRTRADELRSMAAARGLRQSLGAMFVLSAVLMVGGAALHAWLDSSDTAPRRATSPLGAPERGELLVVADPWAHVFVDGQKLDTTPFATPIVLPAGIHHVRLEHPNAPPERREIDLRSGQRLLLDIAMRLQHESPDAGGPDAGAAP